MDFPSDFFILFFFLITGRLPKPVHCQRKNQRGIPSHSRGVQNFTSGSELFTFAPHGAPRRSRQFIGSIHPPSGSADESRESKRNAPSNEREFGGRQEIPHGARFQAVVSISRVTHSFSGGQTALSHGGKAVRGQVEPFEQAEGKIGGENYGSL